MRTKKHLTDTEKARCLRWLEEGATLNKCATRLQVSKSTVKRLKARSIKEGGIPLRKKGSGRPRIVTKKDLRVIRDAIKSNPRLTAKSIKLRHPKTLSHLSIRTISRVLLDDLKLESFVATEKPFISKITKRKRVIFAKKYKSLSPKQWDNVLFSDESIFQASVSEGGRRVRRIRGQGRYEEKYTKRTIKNPPSQMI